MRGQAHKCRSARPQQAGSSLYSRRYLASVSRGEQPPAAACADNRDLRLLFFTAEKPRERHCIAPAAPRIKVHESHPDAKRTHAPGLEVDAVGISASLPFGGTVSRGCGRHDNRSEATVTRDALISRPRLFVDAVWIEGGQRTPPPTTGWRRLKQVIPAAVTLARDDRIAGSMSRSSAAAIRSSCGRDSDRGEEAHAEGHRLGSDPNKAQKKPARNEHVGVEAARGRGVRCVL